MPLYTLAANTTDITGKIDSRLIEMTVTDEAGWQSDTVSITLDDRDGMLDLPRKGAVLNLGIMGMHVGKYVVDELELSGPPASLTITGKAADMTKSLKATRTQSWDQVTLGDVATTIAARHELTAKIAPELAAIELGHIDQTEESDMNLLTRLSRDYDAVIKPVNQYLVVAPKGQAKSVSGLALAAVTLTPSMVSTWHATLADRPKHGGVTARYHDPDRGATVVIKVGSGSGDPHDIRSPFPSAGAALAAANAKFNKLQRGTGTLSLSCPGNPALCAEATVILSGFRDGLNGAWTITRAVHTLDRKGGYSTKIDAEIKI